MPKKVGLKHGKHQTIPKDIRRWVDRVRAMPGVTKVVLGRFHPCGNAYTTGTVRYIEPIDAGFKAKGYCGDGVIDLFVYTNDLDTLVKLVEETQ